VRLCVWLAVGLAAPTVLAATGPAAPSVGFDAALAATGT
jgi:hypothetical protein